MKIKKKNRRKWSKRYENAKFAFWNPWSYSNERHEYCKSLDNDITGLTELHNNQKKPQFQGNNWICSELADVKDGKYTDPAAGVAILLSVIKQDGEECVEQGTCGDKDCMGAATRADMQSVRGGGLCATQRKTSSSYS